MPHLIGGDFNIVLNAKLDRKNASETTRGNLETGHQELQLLCDNFKLKMSGVGDTHIKRPSLSHAGTLVLELIFSFVGRFICRAIRN